MVKIEGIERIYLKFVLLKKLLVCFSVCLISTIYNYRHLLSKIDETGTDFLSTFFTNDFNFRNFKNWITFHSDILDGSLSRSV